VFDPNYIPVNTDNWTLIQVASGVHSCRDSRSELSLAFDDFGRNLHWSIFCILPYSWFLYLLDLDYDLYANSVIIVYCLDITVGKPHLKPAINNTKTIPTMASYCNSIAHPYTILSSSFKGFNFLFSLNLNSPSRYVSFGVFCRIFTALTGYGCVDRIPGTFGIFCGLSCCLVWKRNLIFNIKQK